MSPSDLDSEDRLRLVRFVCSFAWADLEVRPEERAFVHRLVRELDLPPHERQQVEGWLASPPDPEDVDPLEIPTEHRRIFLKYARGVIRSDDVVDELEVETFSLFEKLIR